MAKHYIIMSSSYTDGTRVALDITETVRLNSDAIAKIIREIRQNCGEDVPLSTHFLETNSASWESVAKYDPFFEGIECVPSVSEFSKKIKRDRVLTGLDVAIYILSKIKCTSKQSLEKLCCIAYENYLCEYNDILYIQPLESCIDSTVKTNVRELPARSRILFAKDGIQKLNTIDKTIQNCSDFL